MKNIEALNVAEGTILYDVDREIVGKAVGIDEENKMLALEIPKKISDTEEDLVVKVPWKDLIEISKYMIERRVDCIAIIEVLIRNMAKEPDLYSNTTGVVWFKKGERVEKKCPTCFHVKEEWVVTKTLIAEAEEVWARMNCTNSMPHNCDKNCKWRKGGVRWFFVKK